MSDPGSASLPSPFGQRRLCTLDEVQPGRRVAVFGVSQSDVGARLGRLGFVDGAQVEVLRPEGAGDRIMYRVRGANVVLARQSAANVVVVAPA